MPSEDFLLQAALGALEGFRDTYVPFKRLEVQDIYEQGREKRRRQAEQEQLLSRQNFETSEADRQLGRQKQLEQYKVDIEPPTPLFNTETEETFFPPEGSKTLKPFSPYSNRPQKPLARPGDKEPNQAQSLAAGYANRMEQASSLFDKLEGQVTGMGVIEQTVRRQAPNFAKGATMQSQEQAERNFLNSVLRRESGAVISPTEFDEGRKQYFPQPGDGPDVLKLKKQNRMTAIETMKGSAGRAYSPAPGLTTPAIGGGSGGWDNSKESRYQELMRKKQAGSIR